MIEAGIGRLLVASLHQAIADLLPTRLEFYEAWLNPAGLRDGRILGIKTGDTTPDGRIYLKKEEECLAACVGAPMMMVDHVYHENLTPAKVDEILDALT